MKNKRTAISRATKIFLATSAIALSATVMAQFSRTMTYEEVNGAVRAYLRNSDNDRSPEAIQAMVSTAMSAGVSAKAMIEALIASRSVPLSDAVSAVIKQGGDPAMVGPSAVGAIEFLMRNDPDRPLRSDLLAQVKTAGGDVSGLYTIPGGREVEVVLRQIGPTLISSLNTGAVAAEQYIQNLIRQNGAEAVATALAFQGVDMGDIVKFCMTTPSEDQKPYLAGADQSRGRGSLLTTSTPEAAKSLMDGILKGARKANGAYQTAAYEQNEANGALIEVIRKNSVGPIHRRGDALIKLLKELSKTVGPSTLAAIASQFSTLTPKSGTYDMAMNISGPLTAAVQSGVPLETLMKAVAASGFTTPTEFEVSIDKGKVISDTAAETLIRLAANSDADLKTVMAAVKASGGSTDAYVTAAISAGIDPAKVTEATASGSPSPAPEPAPVAGTPATPSPPAFGGSSGSTISGGGGGAVSKS